MVGTGLLSASMASFDKRTRDDEKPPSFPWSVATEELLGAAQVPSPPAQEAVTRLPVKIEIHAVI